MSTSKRKQTNKEHDDKDIIIGKLSHVSAVQAVLHSFDRLFVQELLTAKDRDEYLVDGTPCLFIAPPFFQ